MSITLRTICPYGSRNFMRKSIIRYVGPISKTCILAQGTWYRIDTIYKKTLRYWIGNKILVKYDIQNGEWRPISLKRKIPCLGLDQPNYLYIMLPISIRWRTKLPTYLSPPWVINQVQDITQHYTFQNSDPSGQKSD